MSSLPGSVSLWLERLKAGQAHAVQPLWERYFRQLVGLAEHRLAGVRDRAADGEDLALSAFHSFYQGVERGRFPRLEDRDDLWQVLIMLTVQKAVNLRERERRAKHGGGRVARASELEGSAAERADAFAEVMGREPTPELAAGVQEECRRLLAGLGDDELRAVAVAKMEGYTNEEIAARLGRSLATVERKLQRIRKAWEQEWEAADTAAE
jgi:DNA-directed RNA polymerase specialized sigma24 family protein